MAICTNRVGYDDAGDWGATECGKPADDRFTSCQRMACSAHLDAGTTARKCMDCYLRGSRSDGAQISAEHHRYEWP